MKVTLEGETLTITTTGPGKLQRVEVTYQIGGPEVAFTGLDGDQFHIKASRQGTSLVFTGHEHEDGRDYPVHEIWTLQDRKAGQVLVIKKDSKDPDEHETSVTEYLRAAS